jgi:hypothetical protein
LVDEFFTILSTISLTKLRECVALARLHSVVVNEVELEHMVGQSIIVLICTGYITLWNNANDLELDVSIVETVLAEFVDVHSREISP